VEGLNEAEMRDSYL
jgi:hypothetical protein